MKAGTQVKVLNKYQTGGKSSGSGSESGVTSDSNTNDVNEASFVDHESNVGFTRIRHVSSPMF